MILTTVFRGWLGMLIEDVTISFILFFGATFIFIKRKKITPFKAGLYFSVSLLSLILIAAIVDGQLPTIGLPNMISAFLGVICGSLFSSRVIDRKLSLSLTIAFFTTTIWYVVSGYKLWANYIFNGTFTGVLQQPPKNNWYTYNETGDTFRSHSFGSKFVVLDFWTTSCIVCRKQFPHFEKFFNAYKNNRAVVFQLVNVPLGTDTPGLAAKIIGYKESGLPTAYADTGIVRAFEINSYPVYLLLKNDTILYKGMYIEKLEAYLSNALKKD